MAKQVYKNIFEPSGKEDEYEEYDEEGDGVCCECGSTDQLVLLIEYRGDLYCEECYDELLPF